MSDNKNIDKNQNKNVSQNTKTNQNVNKEPAAGSVKIKINDFCDRLRDDKQFMMKVSIGVVAVLLVIVIAVAVLGDKKAETGDGTDSEAVVAETGDGSASDAEAGTVSESTISLIPEEAPVSADTTGEAAAEPVATAETAQTTPTDQINDLITRYFAALETGDTDAIATMKSQMTEEEILKTQKKSNYIEKFENMNVLSKNGPVEDSYIAFVYYEIKFKDIATLAPGLTTLYICNNDAGELHIYDGELEQTVTDYIKSVAAADDVKEIFNRVDVKYNEATDQDPTLKAFMENLNTTLEQEIEQEMAQSQPEEVPVEEPAQETQTAAVTESVKTTDTVNVRSSDSENADKLGKLDAGTTVTRYEAKENGWSRIDYEGQEAYVKSEYLEVVSQETEAEDTTEEQESETAPVTVEGKVLILETVNVRKSANENSDRIGTAYQGEYYDLIMKQADGWTKISFNGKVGYVKSEYVE